MELRGATALVTGGASGLGAATARRLHAGGAAVVLLDLPGGRGEAVGRDLADELSASGAPAVFAPADVTDEAQVRSAVDRSSDEGAGFGSLRVVVNCAGIATPGKVLGREG